MLLSGPWVLSDWEVSFSKGCFQQQGIEQFLRFLRHWKNNPYTCNSIKLQMLWRSNSIWLSNKRFSLASQRIKIASIFYMPRWNFLQQPQTSPKQLKIIYSQQLSGKSSIISIYFMRNFLSMSWISIAFLLKIALKKRYLSVLQIPTGYLKQQNKLM